MHAIATPTHLAAARRVKQLWSRVQKARDLIAVGAYVRGNDPVLEQGIELRESISQYLQQDLHEKAECAASIARLESLVSANVAHIQIR